MYGWSVTKRKGARRGDDGDVEIVVASGNSAVPLVVIELGGVEMGGEDDPEMIGVGDVGGLELMVGLDRVGVVVPMPLLSMFFVASPSSIEWGLGTEEG